MDLSIIIVNYKVKHFLDQCLHSVLKASKRCSAEIFVVDNNSLDGSVQLVREKFPEIQLIENEENIGFSRANNQAIKLAKGKYILLLNPDTVVEEDTFEKVISFMNNTPNAGGLGVKMIDGKGNFLPESKRGLPTPWVAFYKTFGLSKLFPRSKKFGKYHLSYLNKNETHEVDVLAGAFMLLRKSVLDKVGILDETFFMYGEDIDLSYRIQQGGFKNFYFPETTIIHYKGESTKKGSLNYVRMFYKAMIIFAKKHFPGEKASAFTFLIHLAIYFRAILSFSKRIINKTLLPLIDGILIFFGFQLLTPMWANFRFQDSEYYPNEFYNVVIPIYILFFIVGILLSGGYKKPILLFKVLRGVLWALFAILLAYSLVDENYRFSRAIILMGAAWTGISLVLFRFILSGLKIKSFELGKKKAQNIAIVGHLSEAERVNQLLNKTQINAQVVGFIALNKNEHHKKYIGDIDRLEEIARMNSVDEIIFCAEDISSTQIIEIMHNLTPLGLDYKIAPPESLSMIGSNSTNTSGDLYVVNIDNTTEAAGKKRSLLLKIGLLLKGK